MDKKDQTWTLLKDNRTESEREAADEGVNTFQCNLADDNVVDDAMQTDVNDPSETDLSAKDEQRSHEHTKTYPDIFPEPHEEMFYLPQWDVCPKRCTYSQSAGSLEIILSNVKRLLSRSPPERLDPSCSLSLPDPAPFDDICKSPTEDFDHFQVNFNLDHDESSSDSDSLDCKISAVPPESVALPDVSAGPHRTANSPSWDDVFDDDVDDPADKNAEIPLESEIPVTGLDESIDLFDDDDDDDAFLQMSLPNIQTPNKYTIIPEQNKIAQVLQNASNISNDEESSDMPALLGHKAPSEQKSDTFNYSQDIFSVNFDLGFFNDSEEEESAERASDIPTEPKADRGQTYTSLPLNKPNTSTNGFMLGSVSTPRACPVGKKLPSFTVRSNLSPIINKPVRPNTSTPTPGFTSPKIRNLEVVPNILSSEEQPCGTGNRLCRRSLPEARKPVYKDFACSGQFTRDFVLD